MGFSYTTYADDHDKSEKADSLYISDGGDDSVKRFDAKTGAYLGDFVPPNSNGLFGPRGLVFFKGKLHLVNQNVDQPFNGEIFQYRRDTGNFLKVLVSRDDPKGPFAPFGLIRGSGNTLYVADFNFPVGAVIQFNAETGEFIGDLDPTGFTPAFIPRAIVRGPDDLLYVSVIGDLSQGEVLPGYILRFDPRNGKFVDVFTSNVAAGCATHLHRPTGLVFSPDGKLYVVSFRADPSDTDRVLVFNGKTGECVDEINLAPPASQAGEDHRAFAYALLFGPKGRLFVPIVGPVEGSTGPVTGIHTGEVRRYNVKTKTFDIFIPAGGVSQSPSFLTFGKTDSSTLEYDD
jgi:DNA-binding beta-propeller fold protein YncE